MKRINIEDIRGFLAQYNYDVRLTGNARWIDQKCTSDVITIVSDCILQYKSRNPATRFTSMDIWHDEYTVANVEAIFKKPSPDEAKARNEYDKFFQQPMEMLAYANVLIKHKKGSRNYYSIAQYDILEFLSVRERNSLTFLQLYISKVLQDSGILCLFSDFFEKQTKDSYESVKDGFVSFTLTYTPINGEVECRRIFIKVMNPLAYLYGKCGTEKGRMSKGIITYDRLMYNRDNFRDIYAEKPKELTRKQYAQQVGLAPSYRYSIYTSQKAKRIVRAFNDAYRGGMSEIRDGVHDNDFAVNIHHIFPESDFPEISGHYENLIALTPTQHFSYAHPLGNTSRIDPEYQHVCLLAKAGVIEEALSNTEYEQIYEFDRFLFVLFIGLDNGLFLHINDCDFIGTVSLINLSYS